LSLKEERLHTPASWETRVLPVVESVNIIGSRDTTELDGLAISHVAVTGLPAKVTRSVSKPAWNMTFPVFQLDPMEGSPALLAKPVGAGKFWYV
jgi:hypothetical protein